MQVDARGRPVAAIDEIVPVRDLIVDRAAGVTIRDAAVHAARRLVARRLFRERDHELAEMPDAVGRRRVAAVLTLDLEKAGDLAQRYAPELRAGQRRASPLPAGKRGETAVAATLAPTSPWGGEVGSRSETGEGGAIDVERPIPLTPSLSP